MRTPRAEKSKKELEFELKALQKELEDLKKFKPVFGAPSSGALELRQLHELNFFEGTLESCHNGESVIKNSLSELRRIFSVDRAWCMRPSDWDDHTWIVPYASTAGEYTFYFKPTDEVPFPPVLSRQYHQIFKSKKPVLVNAKDCFESSDLNHTLAGGRQALFCAVIPPVGQRWIVGMQHCTFEREWPLHDQEFFRNLTVIMTQSLAKKQTMEELQQNKRRLQNLSAEIFDAGEEERKNFAREIHDELGQPLIAIKMGLDNALYTVKDGPDNSLKGWLNTAADLANALVERVRMMQDALYPTTLQEFGLVMAIESFIKTYEQLYPKILVHQTIRLKEEDIPEALKSVIFRIAQEAMYNAAKHSGADTLSLSLDLDTKRLCLTIRDNGCGFDLSALTQQPGSLTGLGLPSMQERAEATGGLFDIHSSPGKGTYLQAGWERKHFPSTPENEE